MIEVKDVSYVYQDAGAPTNALDAISFRIRRQEIVSIVGPSGCGKSTLLHLVAGFLRPTQGSVLVNGTSVDGPGPERGVVFQNYALFRWLTVQDNVEFGPRMRGVKRAERKDRARHYLDMMGLSDFADRYVYQLSGGMQQRVAIARVLANQPEILLMDEPFAALDAQTRELLQEELLRIWMQVHSTILFVTHSVDEAIFISTRIILLTARPGSIHCVLSIDLPEPRCDYRIRTSAEFNRYKLEISDTIRKVIAVGVEGGQGAQQRGEGEL